MLPYLIAGVIGYGISKLFDDKKAPKYNDGGLVAPNGKPSNLTPEQYKLVRTKAFKDWFGDWENDPANASKVVDSNGEPLVVYHGTKENWWKDYFVFNTQYEGKSSNIKRRKFGSIYFTSKKKVAQTFGNILIPVFLNFKNPIVIDGDYHDIMWVDDELETTNYEDDIIIKNTYDYRVSNVKLDADMSSDIFLVSQIFNKIKLADGTNTTFDGSNPDIRFDGGGNVNDNSFEKWFNNSKVVDKKGNPLIVYHGSPDLRGLKEKYIFKSRFADNQSFFFTDNYSMAKSYADPKNAFDYQNAEEGVIGLYLSLQNPLIVNAFNQIWRKFEITIDGNEITGTRNLIKFAKDKGYDGVIVENVRDYYNNNEKKTKGGNLYVAFEPTQIKIADGTNTTFDGNNPDIRFDEGGLIADNIFDYLKEKGFVPLGKGFWGKLNCTIKIDFSNVLYQQNGDNRVWVSPIEYSDYKKAFTILEFHCKDKNKGIGTALLKEIIQGADLFGYTIFIEPTSMKKYRVETDINTNDLKQWYSKYDFKPLNDNYSDNVWLRNPNNPDIRFDDGGNIDDVLDKMLQGEELSQEDKNKMSLYQKHLLSGENDNTFEYHRVSELNIADTNSEEHINKSQIVVQFESDQKIDVKYMLKKIALTLKKSNIDSVVGFGFKMLAYIGYFVEVNEYDIEKAMSVLKNIGFNATINPYYNTLYFSNEVKDDIKFQKLSENPDIIILSNSEIYQKLNLTDAQSVTRLTKLLKNFGITSYFIMKNQLTITDKSKIDDLINYLNSKGYNAIRFKKRR